MEIIFEDLTAVSTKRHSYTTFASDLGWAPGSYPREIQLVGAPFVHRYLKLTGLEFDGTCIYQSPGGSVQVRVFND